MAVWGGVKLSPGNCVDIGVCTAVVNAALLWDRCH